MKKNISVNIFGTLYPIDEDAYELLKQYNENMRRYYSRMEDGEEIADDVEHRVAELLSELRAQGVMAITIEHVKEIINRIGDPQDLDDDTSGTSNAGNTNNTADNNDTTNNSSNQEADNRASYATGASSDQYTVGGETGRKLFRDSEDKILGGVLSGLSHYFGIKEPIVLRLLMIILTITTFSSLALIYIIAWILIPEAITPEERLRMYGKPVSAKAINEELMRGINSANNFVHSPEHRDTARGCLSALMKFVLFCFCSFFIFILGCILLAVIAAIAGVSIATIFGTNDMIQISGVEPDFFEFMQWIPRWLIITTAVSGLLVIGLPLFGLIRLMSNKNDSRYSSTTKAFLILAWVLCLGVCIGASCRIAKISQTKWNEYYHNRDTHNGVYIPGRGWQTLKEQGWVVENLEGTKKGIDDWNLLPNGEMGHFISLQADNNPNEMSYNFSQTQELRPGKYNIEGYVRADGEGNSLYVINNGGKDTIRVEIPEYKGATNAIGDEEVVVDSNDGSWLWSHVQGTFEVKEPCNVKFGISNEKGLSIAPWNSHKVEIAEVKLTKGE